MPSPSDKSEPPSPSTLLSILNFRTAEYVRPLSSSTQEDL